MAVQLKSLSAAIMPATTLVLPTLRECPPMTTIAIRVLSQVLTRFNTPMMIGTSGNRVIGEPGHRKIWRAWALSVDFIAPGNESDFPISRCPDHQLPRFSMPYNVSTVTWNARSAFRYLMATVALTVLVAL